MKKHLILAAAVFGAQMMWSQNPNYSYNDLESFASDDYIERHTDIPVVRNIMGGTVIRVTYEGEWTNEMKGAFEYACKIWEENIPPCLPLNVTARVGELRGGKSALSKVNVPRLMKEDYFNSTRSSITSRIKGVLLLEYDHGMNNQFVANLDYDFLSSPDLVVTYNKDRLDEFSYSLDSTPTDKYDFVTLVLRDLSRMMGIFNGVSASGGNLRWSSTLPTHYEAKIWNILTPTQPTESYQKATGGKLLTNLNGARVYHYAPQQWQDGVSLNTYLPDSAVKISQLLTYDFGRGSVIRDISHQYSVMFMYELGWNYVFTTGGDSSELYQEGSTENNVEYGGSLEFGSIPHHSYYQIGLKEVSDMIPVSKKNAVSKQNNHPFNIIDSIKPYSVRYNSVSDRMEGGGNWIFSLLKKDGTWDCVYTYYDAPYLKVSVSDFNLHFPKEEYARTCDGKLRMRLVKINQVNNYERRVYSDYYVIEELPQMVEMKFSRLAANQIDDEYLRDVEIGMKNLEGAERVFVEQWIDGDTYPQLYEIEDFKKGYFTVTVDKEFYTDLVVTAYNKNGSTQSATYRLEPLEPVDYEVEASVTGDAIEFSQPSGRRGAVGSVVAYAITPIDCFREDAVMSGEVTIGDAASAAVDVSGLSQGLYALRYNANGKRKSIKFMKR